ncbi:type VI secretion system Vgr family protein, partial [Atlantibacter hermannii]|uniref:type VI secretion system Vgr family protein n=3 Tax=Atlantibacter TaxID=1903434 RepID=UPI0019348034
MARTFTLNSSAMPYLLGEPALVLAKLEGEETFSRLYSYTITAKTPANPAIPWQAASNIDLKALIGKEMTVSIELDGNGLDDVTSQGKGTREISGIVQQSRYIGRDADQAMFEIIIRPWLYLTELTSDFKIFQKKSVVDIIDEVLADYPFPFEKRLSGSYPELDFQVQYGETDYNFIQRLMEEWGIYWFFEHKGGKHKLILVDHVGAHKKSDSAAYHVIHYLPENPKAGEEYINSFHHQETITTGQWVTNDYDFTKSRADILAIDNKPRKTSFNSMEMYHWPGDYEQPSIGEQLARIRMEERGALGSRAQGVGEVRGIACGMNFDLASFPLEKANREYMVISSYLKAVETPQTHGAEIFQFECRFTVQPTTKIFRAPFITPKPKTSGPQTAIIVGPPGEDVWTDEYGRVKVRFVWDRYGKNIESDSCWLRVSQSWAGNNFGGIYIPRVGHEVIVDFINGDPDRPLIIGSLYNNITMPPWDLPANSTQSGLISRTIGGGRTNYNGIRFEDKPGLEQYWEQAERDMDRVTKRNETQTIGVNSDIKVGENRKMYVGADYSKDVCGGYTKLVGLNYTLNVGVAREIVVGAESSLTVAAANALNVGGSNYTNVGDANMTTIGSDNSLTVGGSNMINVSSANMTTIGAANSLTVGATNSTNVGAANSLTVGAANSTNVGGANMTNVGGVNMTSVGGANMTNVGGVNTLAVGGAHAVAVGGAASLVAGGAIAMSAGGVLTISATVIKLIGASKVVIQGGQVHLNPGDGGGGGGGGG